MVACRRERKLVPKGAEGALVGRRNAATHPQDFAMTVTIPSHFLEACARPVEGTRLSSRPRISIISGGGC